MNIKGLLVACAISLFSFAGVAAADSYCAPCPFDCSDLGLGHKDCSELGGGRGMCCLDLTKRGLQVAQAMERAAGGRQQQARETCPSGFQPSEQKCSTEERRRGCKDMRLPGGLGCVRR